MFVFVCVCVCVCVCGRLEREKAMLCRVMYLMIMQAYGVCALIKVLGMIMVLRLISHVLVVIAVFLYLMNESVVAG